MSQAKKPTYHRGHYIRRAKTLVYVRPNRETARNAKIIAKHRNGMSVIELAQKFRLSRTRIYKILESAQPNAA